MMHRVLTIALAGLLAGGPTSHAQADTATARVRGIAYDSLRGRPLADAFVAIVGSDWNATSDSLGRFAFDRVRPGTYQVTMHHSLLDTLGFAGLSTRVVIAAGAAEVRVAVPSFPTLWGKACGTGPVPADSGIIYGTVRNAVTNRAAPHTSVAVTWYDSISITVTRQLEVGSRDRIAFGNARRQPYRKAEPPMFESPLPRRDPPSMSGRFTLNHWNLQAVTDESGTYAVCGVPVRASGLRIIASTDSASSDSIDVALDPRVRRSDLRVGPTVPLGAATRGVVTGQLTDADGRPFAHARVFMGDADEVRSDENGRFVLRDVAVGTRRVIVRYVGMKAARATVDVIAGDTATVTMQLSRVPLLPGMRATATSLTRVLAAEFDVLRRLGLGYIVDSTVIGRHTSVVNVLRGVPSLSVVYQNASLSALVPDGRGGSCTPTVWLDGMEAAYGNLMDLEPSEVMALEVYIRPVSVPAAFVEKGGDRKCGVILVWTRYAFRNR